MTFKGAAHVHSQHSFDGSLALKDIRTLYRSHDYQFVLLSEHIEHHTPDTLRKAVLEAFSASTDDFLFLPGIEIDELHVLLYGVMNLPSYSSPIDLVVRTQQQGALVAISHPVKLRGSLPEGVRPLVNSVEIWNARYDGRTFPRWTPAEVMSRFTEPPADLIPLVGHDFHRANDICDLSIVVDAPAFDRDSILTSIHRRAIGLYRGQHPIPVGSDQARGPLAKLYTTTRDLAYSFNAQLAKSPIRIPRTIRTLAKRFL